MDAERYPLSWPAGWKRTKASERKPARFTSGGSGFVGDHRRPVSVSDGIRRLRGELRRLGVADGDYVISTNLATRLDGLPYSTAKDPDDPGVAVYFRLKKQDRVLACDTWNRVAGNLTAIAQHIDALRRIDRYGVGTLEQAFAGYAALPAKGGTWRTTLGFGPDDGVDAESIESRFRARAREAHPDVPGGSHESMAALNEARTQALKEVGSR